MRISVSFVSRTEFLNSSVQKQNSLCLHTRVLFSGGKSNLVEVSLD